MCLAHKSALILPALGLIAGIPISGQSVVSTHSGVIYFFTGSAFVDGAPLEQKFGRFPDLGEGHELRTALGRAEVLLTPGTFLRIDQNSSIRMLSTSFADTRVELLGGSAILDVTEATKGTSVRLIFRNWQVQVPDKGVCRIDAEPPQLRAYEGKAEIVATGEKAGVTLREGEVLPLAAVLVPEPSPTPGDDDFAYWQGLRSQAISADNTIAAGIVDHPGDIDGDPSGLPSGGGYTYFPMTASPYPDIGGPYGLSFWSPYQSAFSSVYFSPFVYYPYGPLYRGVGNARRPYPGRPFFSPGFGAHRPLITSPRPSVASPRPVAHPIITASPHIAIHAVGHR